MEALRARAATELTDVLAASPRPRNTAKVSRLLCIGLLAACSACLICDEEGECQGGSFNVWVGTSDNAPLPEGTYALTVIPDAGPTLEGECVVSSQGTRVECSGDVVAGAINRRDAFTFLHVSQDPTQATRLDVLLTRNGVVVGEREDEPLEFSGGDSCNDDCGVADVQLEPQP